MTAAAFEVTGMAEPSDLAFDALTLEVGRIRSPSGVVEFSIKVLADGRAFVVMYAHGPDGRRQGETLPLTLDEFANLAGLTAKVSETIERLRGSGRIKTRQIGG